MAQESTEGYRSLAKWLHWIIALCIIALLIIGYLTTITPKTPFRSDLFFYHKSLGITTFLLMLIRLINRLCNPPPKHPGLPRWQKAASHTVHALLYISVFVMILAGWAMSSFGHHPVHFWGLGSVAWPVAKNKALSGFNSDVHLWFAWILFGLVVLHILAALHHHFIKKDYVLRSMLPGKKHP